MNAQQRRDYAAGFNSVLVGIERKYVVRIANILRNQLKAVSNVVSSLGIEYALRRVQSEGIGNEMTVAIRRMHAEVGVVMARRTLSALGKAPRIEKRGFGHNANWIAQMQEYFRMHLLESSTSISETTKNHIEKVLLKAVEEGWTLDRTVKEINDKVYIGQRAEKITRTESVRAANYGVNMGADTYGYVVVKEWCAVNDWRTRPSHRHDTGVDGEIREMGARFSNGLEFPGDPRGSAKEVIQCRCAMAVVPKRDANGRLIPKSRVNIILPGAIPQPREVILI